jgi:hypothetical protein
MPFRELTGEQRRQYIDAKQTFEVWREATREFGHSYRGSMHWRKVGGQDYLARKYGNSWHGLGLRSADTEAIKAAYTEQRTRLKSRITKVDARLDTMSKINRGYSLGRMPTIAARILRKLDAQGLLGTQLSVVGTHALYAYEARAGVMFDGGLMATTDIDLLWDTRRRLRLAIAEDVRAAGVLGILRGVDRSFNAKRGSFRATNDDGFYVDLIRPFEKDEVTTKVRGLGDDADDLEAAAIFGLEWLINAPKFEEVVIADDGRPVWISCMDPRAYALHKFWVSRQPTREATKKKRDAEQARAVAVIAKDYLNLTFKGKDLTALPLQLVKVADDLVAAAKRNWT